MQADINSLLGAIEAAASFSEIRASACLPEPDGDHGYLFVSYSHADYKAVIPDIVRLQASELGIWYDRGLESGKSWIGEVRKKISSYDCRGVLFYISERFLASPSCISELIHYLGATERSALFILVDIARGDLYDRVMDAIRHHAEEGERERLLAAMRTVLRQSPCLSVTASCEEKLKKTKRFAPPPLLSYAKVKSDDPLLWLLHLGTVSVTGVLDRNVQGVRIPRYAKVGKRIYPVRGIAAGAFFGCELLETVEMPRFCHIENAAFVRCPSLSRVRLGRAAARLPFFSLGIVGDALDGCERATLTVGGGRTVFTSAFRARTDLTAVSLPRGQYFAEDAFSGCTALTSVRIKRGDRCDRRTFFGCTALRQIDIPKYNRTRSLHETFSGCRSLRAVTLPRRLRRIGKEAFSGCASLTEITLPPYVGEIDHSAFRGCTALKCVSFLGRVDRLLENTPYHRRQPLDRLFPSAERFYFKRPPQGEPFDTAFVRKESDRRGFILYVKEGKA